MLFGKHIKDIFSTIFSVLFPEKCLVCDNVLEDNEKYICSHCKENHLINQPRKDLFFRPLTFFAKDIVVLFHYRYGAKAIKQFKFHKQISVGKRFAKLLAQEIKQKEWVNEINYIVPVPLHKRALRQREFNQCEIIASVLSKELNIPMENNNLYRIRDTTLHNILFLKGKDM